VWIAIMEGTIAKYDSLFNGRRMIRRVDVEA
jgi:hypothetical protein